MSNYQQSIVSTKRPILIDRFDAINEFSYSGRPFLADDDFSNAIGKKILCKAQGLTGADRKMCESKILAKCGRKPVCSSSLALGILTGGASTAGISPKKCKEKKDAWAKCSQGVTYISPDTGEDFGADTGAEDFGVDTEEKLGLPNWVIPAAIGVSALLLVGIGFAVVSARKRKLSSMQAIPAAGKRL